MMTCRRLGLPGTRPTTVRFVTGAAMPAGQYNIAVTAAVGGTTQSVNPMVVSQVVSVTLDPSTQTLDLNTNNGTVPLSSVASVM